MPIYGVVFEYFIAPLRNRTTTCNAHTLLMMYTKETVRLCRRNYDAGHMHTYTQVPAWAVIVKCENQMVGGCEFHACVCAAIN